MQKTETEKLRDYVSKEIKRYLSLGGSMSDLAKNTGLSQLTVRKIRDKKDNATVKTLQLIESEISNINPS